MRLWRGGMIRDGVGERVGRRGIKKPPAVMLRAAVKDAVGR